MSLVSPIHQLLYGSVHIEWEAWAVVISSTVTGMGDIAFACAEPNPQNEVLALTARWKGHVMSTFFVIADDAIVHRCDDRQFALGYAACHAEQTGEECEVFEVAPVATNDAKGGGA